MVAHSYLITYDISCPRRWRKVFVTMKGFGEHVQLSVFRCDLTARRHLRLKTALERVIHHDQDQVVIVRLGPASEKTIDGIEVLGKPHVFERAAPKIV